MALTWNDLNSTSRNDSWWPGENTFKECYKDIGILTLHDITIIIRFKTNVNRVAMSRSKSWLLQFLDIPHIPSVLLKSNVYSLYFIVMKKSGGCPPNNHCWPPRFAVLGLSWSAPWPLSAPEFEHVWTCFATCLATCLATCCHKCLACGTMW